MRLSCKAAWMWQRDIYEDMWNHGTLLGVIFVRTTGMPDGPIRSLSLPKDTPAVDSYFLYVGFLLFYVRVILRLKSKLNPTFVRLEDRPEYQFDPDDTEQGEYERKMDRIHNLMSIHPYRWRSVSSLAYDLKMREPEVAELLSMMERNGQVVKAPYFGIKDRVQDDI